MNTKMVMGICALFLGSMGIVLSFLPQEAASYLGWPTIHPILLQILGAVCFGFAMVNWIGKANLIGGIYGKPIALGNFNHFAIGVLALSKWVINSGLAPLKSLTAIATVSGNACCVVCNSPIPEKVLISDANVRAGRAIRVYTCTF